MSIPTLQHYITRILLNPSKDFFSYPAAINPDLLAILEKSQQPISITIEFVVMDWDIRWSVLLAKYVKYYRRKLKKRSANIKAIYIKFYFIKSAKKALQRLPSPIAKQICVNNLTQPTYLNEALLLAIVQCNSNIFDKFNPNQLGTKVTTPTKTSNNFANKNFVANVCLTDALQTPQEFFKGPPVELFSTNLAEFLMDDFQRFNVKRRQLILRKKISAVASKIAKLLSKVSAVNNNFVMNIPKPALAVGGSVMVSGNGSGSGKIGRYTNRFGLFKEINKPQRSVINLLKAKADNVITLSYELKQTMPKPVKPKSARANIAEKIAKTAIEGAINGLDAIKSQQIFDAFDAIEGLYYEAAFNKSEYAGLVKLITKLLLATRQSLEKFSRLYKECLIRHLAIQLQNNMLIFKDVATSEVEIMINYQIKMADKIKLFKETIRSAITDAEQRMAVAPSAPSYAECELADTLNNMDFTPSAPSLEECELGEIIPEYIPVYDPANGLTIQPSAPPLEEAELALLNTEHAPSAPALADLIDQIPMNLSFGPSYPISYTVVDMPVANINIMPSAPPLCEFTDRSPKPPQFNPEYPM